MADREGSSCRIRRTGVVAKKDGAAVQLEIEGKPVEVPLRKCDPALREGDAVVWSGGMWRARADEDRRNGGKQNGT